MQPLFRIFTFGEFTLERLCSLPESPVAHYEVVARTEWNNCATSMTLLKVLLCRTRRRAHRDVLVDAIWSEEEQQRIKHPASTLSTAASVLRSILQTSTDESLLTTTTTGDGLIFKLPNQQQLWVDADEFVLLIEQAAKAEHTGQDTLPLWEAALALLKGDFLETDLYPGWVQAKRQELEEGRRLCVHHLATLYMQRDKHEQAEALLYTYIATNPMDEDATCILMELFAQSGRHREAQRLYRKLERVLDEDGIQLSPLTRELAERIQQGYIAYRAIGQKASVTVQALFPSTVVQSESEHFTIHANKPPQFLEQQEQPHFTQGVHHLGQLYAEGWSTEEILDSVKIVLPAIQSIPILAGNRVSQEERTQVYEALNNSITAGWKIVSTANPVQIQAVSQAQLAILQSNYAYFHPSIRAKMYSSVYLLQGAGLHSQGYYYEALRTQNSAYLAAVEGGDFWHAIQSRLWQAHTYQALEQHHEAIQAIEAALRLVESQSNYEKYLLAKAHLFACWVDSAAVMQDNRQAQEKLARSEALLDTLSPGEEFDRSHWHQSAGHYALRTQNFTSAISHFEKTLTLIPLNCSIRRTTTSIALSGAYIGACERSTSLTIAENIVSTVMLLNIPSISKAFTQYVQALASLPSQDKNIHTFVASVQRNIALASSATMYAE